MVKRQREDSEDSEPAAKRSHVDQDAAVQKPEEGPPEREDSKESSFSGKQEVVQAPRERPLEREDPEDSESELSAKRSHLDPEAFRKVSEEQVERAQESLNRLDYTTAIAICTAVSKRSLCSPLLSS